MMRRQGGPGVLAGFENGCGGRHRVRRRCTSGVGGCSEDARHPTQIRSKNRIRAVVAAREPVRFRKQKVNADDPRRCRDFYQPGELITWPRPLPDMTN